MIRDGRLEDVYASPIRMEYFTEQLMQPGDLVGETMRVPDSVYRFLGYASEDTDMSLEHFVRHAISLEQKNDTIPDRPTARMTRLKSFYSNVFSVDIIVSSSSTITIFPSIILLFYIIQY